MSRVLVSFNRTRHRNDQILLQLFKIVAIVRIKGKHVNAFALASVDEDPCVRLSGASCSTSPLLDKVVRLLALRRILANMQHSAVLL